MIKTNDLRKGNLFHNITRSDKVHIPATGVVFKVVELLAFEVSAVYSNENPAQVESWHKIKYSDMSPVELTPEWLRKFGFEWDNGYLKKSLKFARMKLGFCRGANDKMSIFQTLAPYEGGREIEIGFGDHHPEYVHQLQNLYFALTGEELTISHEHLQTTS